MWKKLTLISVIYPSFYLGMAPLLAEKGSQKHLCSASCIAHHLTILLFQKRGKCFDLYEHQEGEKCDATIPFRASGPSLVLNSRSVR